jgi:hypothetical protein
MSIPLLWASAHARHFALVTSITKRDEIPSFPKTIQMFFTEYCVVRLGGSVLKLELLCVLVLMLIPVGIAITPDFWNPCNPKFRPPNITNESQAFDSSDYCLGLGLDYYAKSRYNNSIDAFDFARNILLKVPDSIQKKQKLARAWEGTGAVLLQQHHLPESNKAYNAAEQNWTNIFNSISNVTSHLRLITDRLRLNTTSNVTSRLHLNTTFDRV